MGRAEELAAAVDGLEGGKGKRRKYPTELRQRLVELVREQRAAGKQLKSIAARVGVPHAAAPVGGEARRCVSSSRAAAAAVDIQPIRSAGTARCLRRGSGKSSCRESSGNRTPDCGESLPHGRVPVATSPLRRF
jgi:hypothetical protein